MTKDAKNGKIEEVLSVLDQPAMAELIDENDSKGWNVIHYAIFTQNKELIYILIERNADLNALTSSGQSPLQLVIMKKDVSSKKEKE